ncbi:hypothetical protein, partial [Bacteroides cellulosilyticus]|uniref:hypothetical protein n=1 Tax=Bacteroides cellulosilyticus TaxID=246787 RepID=UPI001E47E375
EIKDIKSFLYKYVKERLNLTFYTTSDEGGEFKILPRNNSLADKLSFISLLASLSYVPTYFLSVT